MQDVPKPLMGRDKAFLNPAFPSDSGIRRPVDHELQHIQQFRRDLDIPLVACMMKRDEDLVGQTPSVTRLWIGSVGGWVGHCPLRLGMHSPRR
jgi:hypothetical protein